MSTWLMQEFRDWWVAASEFHSSKKKQAWRVSWRTKFRLFFARKQTSQNFYISDWPKIAELVWLVARKRGGQSNCLLNRPFSAIGPMPWRFTPHFVPKEIKSSTPFAFFQCDLALAHQQGLQKQQPQKPEHTIHSLHWKPSSTDTIRWYCSTSLKATRSIGMPHNIQPSHFFLCILFLRTAKFLHFHLFIAHTHICVPHHHALLFHFELWPVLLKWNKGAGYKLLFVHQVPYKKHTPTARIWTT